MFGDDDDYSRFRSKPHDASKRTTIASQVSHADLGLETSAGPMRLYITTTVVVEIDDDLCPFDEFTEPAVRPTKRLPMRSKR